MTLLDYSGREDTVELELPLIEPECIPDILINGGGVLVEDGILRVIGWQKMTLGGGCPERRLVLRFSMPLATAIAFHKLIGANLSARHRGSH
jgi:hypothetical protein